MENNYEFIKIEYKGCSIQITKEDFPKLKKLTWYKLIKHFTDPKYNAFE